jgi:aspartate/methionine/tyrosine aminotransferase
VFGCRAELDGHVARYRASRDLLVATLTKAGLTRFAPAEGAFYLYVDVSALTGDSQAFCRQMLDEIGVAATPGRDFDPTHGDSWVRLSFAGSSADIAEAASRLADWLPKLGQRGQRVRGRRGGSITGPAKVRSIAKGHRYAEL